MKYRIDESVKYSIKICDRVLDNIYGQIGLTEVEKELERLSIFKRLHRISQLGLVNWIFPCALHTRYVHSLGVMHVASEMAIHINTNMENSFFDDNEIQIIRLAGLLHDIGHYPLSHNIEFAYKESEKIGKYNDEAVSANLKHYVNCPDYLIPDYSELTNNDEEAEKNRKLKAEEDFAKGFAGSTGFHHEHIGYMIVLNNLEIRKIIKDYFVILHKGTDAFLNPFFAPRNDDGTLQGSEIDESIVDEIVLELVRAIGEIIRGNYANEKAQQFAWQDKYSAMVQIIHSDLDADNIDYLLRDATFSGTSYGVMDMGVLLNCLIVSKFINKNDTQSGEKNYRYIVGVQKKGAGCIEQFLLNKFMAYSQMIFSKYVSILEAMILKIESDYLIPEDETYTCDALRAMVENPKTDLNYLAFSDHHIFNKIYGMVSHLGMYAPLPQAIISRLIHSCALELDKSIDYECLCTSLSESDCRKVFEQSSVYQRFKELYQHLDSITGEELKGDNLEKELFSYRFEQYSLTKQLPIKEFINMFCFADMCDERRFNFHYYRLGNGIPILEKDKDYSFEEKDNEVLFENLPELCVDNPLSSLQALRTMQFVVLRKYVVSPYNYVV